MNETTKTDAAAKYSLNDIKKAFFAGAIANSPEMWVSKFDDLSSTARYKLDADFKDFMKSNYPELDLNMLI